MSKRKVVVIDAVNEAEIFFVELRMGSIVY